MYLPFLVCFASVQCTCHCIFLPPAHSILSNLCHSRWFCCNFYCLEHTLLTHTHTPTTLAILRPHSLHPSRNLQLYYVVGPALSFCVYSSFFNFLRYLDLPLSRSHSLHIGLFVFSSLGPHSRLSFFHPLSRSFDFLLSYKLQKTPNVQLVLTLLFPSFFSLRPKTTNMLQQCLKTNPCLHRSFLRRANFTSATSVVGLATPTTPFLGYTAPKSHSSLNSPTNSYPRPTPSSPVPRRLFLDRQCHGPRDVTRPVRL